MIEVLVGILAGSFTVFFKTVPLTSERNPEKQCMPEAHS